MCDGILFLRFCFQLVRKTCSRGVHPVGTFPSCFGPDGRGVILPTCLITGGIDPFPRELLDGFNNPHETVPSSTTAFLLPKTANHIHLG